MGTKATPVIFRKWGLSPGKGSIDAILPTIPADTRGNCTVITKVGGMGAGNYEWMMVNSVPATPDEYRPMLDYIKTYINGPVKVHKRRASWMFDEFRIRSLDL